MITALARMGNEKPAEAGLSREMKTGERRDQKKAGRTARRELACPTETSNRINRHPGERPG